MKEEFDKAISELKNRKALAVDEISEKIPKR